MPKKLIHLQQKLVPELLEEMTKRYHILQAIQMLGPIGRRTLAAEVGLTERVLRKEVQFLQKQGLVETHQRGMTIGPEGKETLLALAEWMKEVSGLAQLERRLLAALPVEEAVVVPGNSERSEWVKKGMGRAAQSKLQDAVTDGDIIAVAGGTTLATVAEMMTPLKAGRSLLFVPARGGLGEQVENQANSICAKMARKAGGRYKLLHVPDELSEEAYESIVHEPGIREVLEKIAASSIVMHGIGEARTMALRRNSSSALLEKLAREHAVAEAFGYYFNAAGQIVHKVKTIGLQLHELEKKKRVITVAGGASKAEAIAAFFMREHSRTVLVTDESAAQSLLQIQEVKKHGKNKNWN